jgi:hypothetical protein
MIETAPDSNGNGFCPTAILFDTRTPNKFVSSNIMKMLF